MEKVFVYGTLKRGERNFPLAEQAGLVRVVSGYVEGFALFHLLANSQRPYAYPAMVPGEGRVYGEVLFLPAEGLKLLDELEEEGIEYRRAKVLVKTKEGMFEAWVYLYQKSLEEAVYVQGGVWKKCFDY